MDNFLTYVAQMPSLVFRTRPETLRSGEQVRVDFVLEHDSMEELTDALAERRVERLAYAGMRKLSADLESSLGFSLFTNEAELERAIYLIESRNLITHNRAIVNGTFVRRVDVRAARKWGLARPCTPPPAGDFGGNLEGPPAVR